MKELKVKKCQIYYDSWQIQCCGDAFSVGDKINWTCRVSEEEACEDKINLHEDHHGEETHYVAGTITKIISECSEVSCNNEVVVYEDVDIIREEIQHANGWESEINDEISTQRIFWGYVVELEDVTIKEIIP